MVKLSVRQILRYDAWYHLLFSCVLFVSMFIAAASLLCRTLLSSLSSLHALVAIGAIACAPALIILP